MKRAQGPCRTTCDTTTCKYYSENRGDDHYTRTQRTQASALDHKDTTANMEGQLEQQQQLEQQDIQEIFNDNDNNIGNNNDDEMFLISADESDDSDESVCQQAWISFPSSK